MSRPTFLGGGEQGILLPRHFWPSFPLISFWRFIADRQSPKLFSPLHFLVSPFFYLAFFELSLFCILDFEIVPTDFSPPTPRPAHNIRDPISSYSPDHGPYQRCSTPAQPSMATTRSANVFHLSMEKHVAP
jgi:hypothetical protein